jgi:hypothetical protein
MTGARDFLNFRCHIRDFPIAGALEAPASSHQAARTPGEEANSAAPVPGAEQPDTGIREFRSHSAQTDLK